MSNNDYFTVAYKILSYLKSCYENGQKADPNILRASLFNISEQQFLQTLKMLTDDGYIKGLIFTPTISGDAISGINQCYVTSSGLQYLKENSEMQRIYKVLKEARDWLPILH